MKIFYLVDKIFSREIKKFLQWRWNNFLSVINFFHWDKSFKIDETFFKLDETFSKWDIIFSSREEDLFFMWWK